MATVLVSFIGRGTDPSRARVAAGATPSISKGGYARCLYKFPAESGFPAEELESTIFGSLLLRRLQGINRQVARWLIMGTPQSVWNDLIEMFPAGQQTALLGIWNKIDDAVNHKTAPLTQELLDEWQAALTREMNGIEIYCRMVGAGDTTESQEKIYQALLDVVRTDDEIVLDITHGFRHQPVLASFMVMLLRWLRGVKQVDVYNGALDLNGNVLKLISCSELLEATEAVATFRKTGNYVALGQCLKMDADFYRNLEKLAFAEEINRPDKQTPQNLKRALNKDGEEFNAQQAALSNLLHDAIAWAAQPNLAKRLRHKADFALKHAQYFKAVVLLWEAILVAGCGKYRIENPTNYKARAQAEELLYENLSAANRRTLRKIEHLRNAVAHGTLTGGGEIVKALSSATEFEKLFVEGRNLLDDLLI